MAVATLKFETRDARGKNEARRLRASGRIPAVLYGAEKGKALAIAVDPKMLLAHSALRVRRQHADRASRVALATASDARVLVKEYQLDPIDHHLLHADFYHVAMDKVLTVTVPIVLKGEAKGVKQQGGIVDFVNREVEIEVLPADIPENITVDDRRADAQPGRARPRHPHRRREVEADQRRRHDARARRGAEGRRGSAGGRCGSRGTGCAQSSPRSSRRARPTRKRRSSAACRAAGGPASSGK